MPLSRELKNKKNETKDRQSRAIPESNKKGGAGGKYNWGDVKTNSDESPRILDRGDPNYDSSEEQASSAPPASASSAAHKEE